MPLDPDVATKPAAGWRLPRASASLPEVHRTIPIPITASFWKKMFAFAGPGYLVAVGYMDPGNWATDLAGGARYGYTLLSVIMISNFMAILLQHLCIKLGVATGRDLAQACRDHYSKPTVIFLWIACEIAIAACDLAEVVGSAIALQLLFGIPLVWGCVITASDVLIILYLQHKGFRRMEAIVIVLIGTIALCFASELLFSKPSLPDVLAGAHVIDGGEGWGTLFLGIAFLAIAGIEGQNSHVVLVVSDGNRVNLDDTAPCGEPQGFRQNPTDLRRSRYIVETWPSPPTGS
jgi:manganese transport protein